MGTMNDNPDTVYFTIDDEVTAERSIKGSKFIAHAIPVNAREGAEMFVEDHTLHYADATHTCFAYKIGVGDRAVYRFHDAGEPSGTAGRPILQAIESRDLTNVVVVVTRYFGGVKLGMGGLARAYGAAASAALDRATVVKKYPQTVVELRFGYGEIKAAERVVMQYDVDIAHMSFEEVITCSLRVPIRDHSRFIADLQNATAGRVEVG